MPTASPQPHPWRRTAGQIARLGLPVALLLGVLPLGWTEGPGQGSAAGAATAVVARAPDDAGWALLSPAQKQALAPLQSTWATLDAGQRETWLLIASRYPDKSLSEQRRLQARMTAWARLTPRQRALVRLRFLNTAMRYDGQHRTERWQAYQQLRPDLRQALAAAAPSAAGGSPPRQPAPGATTVPMADLVQRAGPHGLSVAAEAP